MNKLKERKKERRMWGNNEVMDKLKERKKKKRKKERKEGCKEITSLWIS